MPHCWKSHVTAHMCMLIWVLTGRVCSQYQDLMSGLNQVLFTNANTVTTCTYRNTCMRKNAFIKMSRFPALGTSLNVHKLAKQIFKSVCTSLQSEQSLCFLSEERLLIECPLKTYEPPLDISNNVVCAISKASVQPAHMRSLIRAFASGLNILSLLSYWPNIIWSFKV